MPLRKPLNNDPLATFQVGNTNLYYNPSERVTTSTSMLPQQMFSATMNRSGNIRFSFRSRNNNYYGYTYIRKNGVNLYTFSNNATYITQNVDIPVSKGDVIAIFSTADNGGGLYTYIDQIKIMTQDPMFLINIM